MKTYIGILAITALSLTACSTQQNATSRAYSDDVYYSSKDVAADREKDKQKQIEKQQRDAEAKRAEESRAAAIAQNQNNEPAPATDDYYQATEKTTDQNGDTYVTNNNYSDQPFVYDDYYDYEYATRLRRFHNNVGSYGYYDDYYTNSYWYNSNPYSYGTSVYMGYNFWGPAYATYSYNPGSMMYANYGWGYDPWYHPYGYNPYYNPYMGCGYGYGYGGGYGGYGYGYDNAYMNGYWNGYYSHGYSNNYFNSYDNNSYYYGPRGSMSANSRTTAQPSMAHRYMDVVESETKKPFEETHGRENNQYLKPTTVNDYMSTRPVNANGRTNSYKPETGGNTQYNSGSDRPVTTKPVYGEERPARYNEKPVSIDNTKPRTNSNSNDDYYQAKPRQPQQQRPTSEQKPATEKPSYEQQQPSYQRNNSNNQYQAPASSPAPRNNSSSGGRSGGSSTPSSSPRRR